jgi:hypothetical protein
MAGYRPEPESEVGADDFVGVKTFSFALLAVPLLGLFLLLTGLGAGGYVRVAFGALLLAVSPFIVRWVWRGGLWD